MQVGGQAKNAVRRMLDFRYRSAKLRSLPPLASFQGYKARSIFNDLVAGLVIAALSIPISMGYAQIAGLPPVYGLYASIVPAFVFALLTNTRSIVFGMDSAAVAVTGHVLLGIGIGLGTDAVLTVMPLLTLLVSGFLLLFALTRAGKLVHYVPEPVMNGFILGISITIILRQIPLLLGGPDLDFASLPNYVNQINVPSVALSIFSLCALFFMAAYTPNLPCTIIVLAFGMLFSVAFGLEGQNVKVLGEMQTGLPSLVLPSFEVDEIALLVGGAFSIAVAISIESLLTLNTFSLREHQRPHGDRELLSMAFANAAGSFIGCPPCSASLSRTAAAKSAGGTSQLASMFSALTIAAFVLILAPYLRHLPEPVLASVVVFAMVKVVDYSTLARYARKIREEFAVLVLVACVVIAFGALAGVTVGIIMSLAIHFIRARMTGHEKLMGFGVDDSDDEPRAPSNMLVVYLDGFLSFTNIDRQIENARKNITDDIDTVILEISGVTSVDATASEAIRRLIRTLSAEGLDVRVVRSLAPANDHYTRYELRRILKRVNSYPSVQSAIEDINRKKRSQLLKVPLDQPDDGKEGGK